MSYNIEAFHIGGEEFSSYSIKAGKGEDKDWIENLSKINILIGANNSGKSRFLRTLFEKENLGYKTKNVNLEGLKSLINSATDDLNDIIQSVQYGEVQETIKDGIRNLSSFEHFTDKHFRKNDLITPVEKIKDIASTDRFKSISNERQKAILSEVREICDSFLKQMDKAIPDDISFILERWLEKKYVPILRGLRPIIDKTDGYQARTKQDYFPDMKDAEDRIFTGLHLYEETKKKLLGQRSDRDKVRAFETFLSETFFQGQEVNTVPRDGSDVLYIGIGDDEERPIYELGDGIQSIIILTYPLFFNQGQDLLFFIEEPEHGLHPGMQRVFMETLIREEFSSFQYFLTTHSNHLLDITLDIEHVSIYTFKKDDTVEGGPFLIENVDNDHTDSLGRVDIHR